MSLMLRHEPIVIRRLSRRRNYANKVSLQVQAGSVWRAATAGHEFRSTIIADSELPHFPAEDVGRWDDCNGSRGKTSNAGHLIGSRNISGYIVLAELLRYRCGCAEQGADARRLVVSARLQRSGPTGRR